jgi:hypothetical protein
MANEHGIKPTCREVHRLSSEGLDRKLSLIERTRMNLHLMVCNACRTFTSQLQLMRRAMRQWTIGGDRPDNDDRQ